MHGGVLVRHPAGVDGVHVNAILDVVRCAGARHHVERRLGHVGVRMPVRLRRAIELPLHRADIYDVLVGAGRAHHQRLQTRIENVGCYGIHQVHFEKLRCLDLVQT